MRSLTTLQLFFAYLKSHLKFLIITAMACIVFALVFFLYILPPEAVLYALLLSVVFTLAFFIVDFTRFCRLHRELVQLMSCPQLFEQNLPPETISLLVNDYRALTIRCIHDLEDEKTAAAHTYSDMLEYYTMWAHQIKTPLSAMRLLLQQPNVIDSTTQNALAAELFKTEQYVEMVLGYLRLSDISSDLLIREYDLEAIVKQAVRKYSRLFILKRLSLDFTGLRHPDGSRVTVITDEKWITFVIEQLISNAIKYTRQGQISILMKPDAPCTLLIRDTGIGIRAEDLPRIFDRGFTGYNGRADKQSTGIGLYLCRRILTKLSHSITITSEINKGTTVEIHLETYVIEKE